MFFLLGKGTVVEEGADLVCYTRCMKSHSISGWIGVSILLGFLLLSGWLLSLAASTHTTNLEVSFLDVGQGDATLIETPSGSQVLVDGGSAGQADQPLSEVLPFYDRSLDMVIATHADTDHLGGLVNVLKEYQVNEVVIPARPSDSQGHEAFMGAVDNQPETTRVRKLTRGDTVRLGEGAYLLTLFPLKNHSPTDTNDSSLVFKLLYGQTSWMFSGDSPQAIEEYLAATDGRLLDADVLKVGHHGSDTSSSDIFLSAVSPTAAVISAGADNPHGHPTPAVLDRLQSVASEILCTCETGTAVYVSDGREVIHQQ